MMQPEWLESLRFRGAAPRSLLDVGAHLGHFARQVRAAYPDCAATLIEPNPHCQAELAALGLEHHAVAASAESGEATLFLTTDWLQSTGSSLYRENTPFFRDEVLQQAAVPKVRLDDLLAGRRFDFVKIDTQGSELDVIAGGRKVLAAAQFILIEISMVEFNQGGARAEEVFAALAELGFRRAEVTEFHRLKGIQNGNLLQMDFLFERANGPPRQSLVPAGPVEAAALLAWLRREQQRSADFSILCLATEAPMAAAGLRLASFGEVGQNPSPRHFACNVNDRAGWAELLRHVARHGRFSYAVCTEGVGDLVQPSMLLEHLPLIAEAGCVALSVAGSLPAGHASWTMDAPGGELRLAFEVGRDASARGAAREVRLHWRGGIGFESLNPHRLERGRDHALSAMRQPHPVAA